MLRSTHSLILVAVLVTLFGVLQPSLDVAGFCGHGECPEMLESSIAVNTSFSMICMAAVLSASVVATFAFAAFSLSRRPANRSRPHELYLAPEPPPPQLPA